MSSNPTFPLDRPHRFAVGDYVRHIESEDNDPANLILIEQLTVRISTNGVAYPTYTISARTYGIREYVEDVLDTEDLVKTTAIKARIGDPVDARASRKDPLLCVFCESRIAFEAHYAAPGIGASYICTNPNCGKHNAVVGGVAFDPAEQHHVLDPEDYR